MKLFLESTKVLNLQLSTDEVEGSFAYRPEIINERSFSINFRFVHAHKDGISIFLDYQAIFKVDRIIGHDLLKDPFLHVNAPAIAYPFLRAYVSNLCLMSGYTPLMLPSINFDAEWKKNTKDS